MMWGMAPAVRGRVGLAAAGLIAALLPGCGGAVEDTPPSAPPVVQGTFDVGGHSLYLSCRGSGSPTAVYLHGAVQDTSAVPHQNGVAFQNLLIDGQRVCLYDRRNVGRSNSVEGPQLPADAVADLRKLLAAAGVQPPYVLVGASFGGLLAYLYANQHPGEVAGMVLLDAMFPDEFTLEHLLAPADRFQASDKEDETNTPERISHYKAQKAASAFIGKEPAIPVTYLSSISESGVAVGDPELDRKVLRLQKAYVGRFAPGRFLRVDSPHFMERAIPDTIVEELRRVIATAGS